ncbi:hypothetical protein IJI55_01040 [Candidatus Saccharibacteria bacterium]|nr:hypothetical protein [Candidatus Saccharibacteria bacterium]
MEILDLKNQPVLFLPLSAFSDPVINGSETSFGVNVSMSDNRFFKNLYFTLADNEDAIAIAMSAASERPDGEMGIVLVTEYGHLSVVSEVFTDDLGNQHYLPIIWNARLESAVDGVPEDMPYYGLYAGVTSETGNGCTCGVGYAVYDKSSNIFWNDDEAEAFRAGS